MTAKTIANEVNLICKIKISLESIREYSKNFFGDYSEKYYVNDSLKITNEQLNGVLKCCMVFKPYLSDEDFNNFVIKKIVKFSYIKATYISSSNILKHITTTDYLKIPEHLCVVCNENGYTRIARKFSEDLKPF